jgi:hypothetical protein
MALEYIGVRGTRLTIIELTPVKKWIHLEGLKKNERRVVGPRLNDLLISCSVTIAQHSTAPVRPVFQIRVRSTRIRIQPKI